ncbi:protein NLRC3-like [Centroberyx affinis]|uniref:protein NLRC3-like n=1 Tax=Centroberyx affinis TaxID=166261 RepID=UPI003A5BDD9B
MWLGTKDTIFLGEKKLLNEIYTEIYLTDGGDIQINMQHGLRQIEMASRKLAETDKSIKPSDIFKHPSGKYKPIRTVLTTGIAGIGKTFLVNKFILDWTEGRTNQDIHLTFPFTFRQLNLMKGKTFRFAELIHSCIKETRDINEEALNEIFTTLQTSEHYDKCEFKVLFVLDGLDESRFQLDFTANEECSVDVTESASVEVLLTNLIKGKLLPSARLWVTTRPVTANQIPGKFVDMVTEVRGFTDRQKEDYFRKRFRDEEQASRIISHIKSTRNLHIMCHIPVFCWITATVLEDLLEAGERGDLPKSLTEIYILFLVFQIDQMKKKYGREKSIQYIQSLALAVAHGELDVRLKVLEYGRPSAAGESGGVGDVALNVVIRNLPHKENEVTLHSVNCLIKDGLKIKDIECVTAERKQSQSDRPGVIIAKFSCQDHKKTVMNKKAMLQKNKMYKKVFINHDIPKQQRTIESSFFAILKEMGTNKLVVQVGGGL